MTSSRLNALLAVGSDSRGQTVVAAISGAAFVNAAGVPGVLGRLHHTARRWSWAVRYQDMTETRFDDGSRFVPVATLADAVA